MVFSSKAKRPAISLRGTTPNDRVRSYSDGAFTKVFVHDVAHPGRVPIACSELVTNIRLISQIYFIAAAIVVNFFDECNVLRCVHTVSQ